MDYTNLSDTQWSSAWVGTGPPGLPLFGLLGDCRSGSLHVAYLWSEDWLDAGIDFVEWRQHSFEYTDR